MAPGLLFFIMADSCIFCQIVAGDIPSRLVYKDEHTCAFLDVDPLTKGHTVVIPVRHYTRLEALPREEAAQHLATLPQIVEAVTQVAEADASTIAWNNGPAAGQEVPHLHAHIIPRSEHDDHGAVHTLFKDRPSLSETEMDQIAHRLETALTHHPSAR